MKMNKHSSYWLLALLCAMCLCSCSSTKWTTTTQPTDGMRYLKQLVRSLPFEIDSICAVSEDYYLVFENEQPLTFAPDYEITIDSVVYNMNGEVFHPDAQQRKDVIWRNIYVQPRQHRLLCMDRVYVGKRWMGIIYVIQSPYKGLRDFPYSIWHNLTSWDCTDFRNTMLLSGFYDEWMDTTFSIRINRQY